MLKQLRHKKTARKIWITLAVLVLPAFLFWGFGSMVRNNDGEKFAGKINNRSIPEEEFDDSLSAVRNQAIIQFGDKFSEVQNILNLKQEAWDRLVLLKEAERRGISVSDKEVIDLVQSYPFFQDKGAFNNRIYGQMLQFVFHTQARVFEEQARQNLMIAKLFRQFTEKITASDEETKEEYRRQNETLSVDYIASLPSDFSKEITPLPEDVKKYFEKNSFQFKVPLTFDISYIELVAKDADDPATKDKARSLFLRLTKKEPLDKVAKDNGLTVKESGFFPETGPIPGIGWSPQALNLIIKAVPGQYLNPIHIDKSYYLILLKERKEPYVPDFDAIKDRVKEALIKERSLELAKEKVESCFKALKEMLASNPKDADFNKTAKTFGLKSSSTDSFKYSGYIEGIGASDKFWDAADNLKGQDISPVLEMPSGYYIIKLKSRSKIDDKKFETEKEEFKQKLLSQKKQEAFNKFSEELKSKAVLK